MSAPIEILLVEDNPADVWLARDALKEHKILNDIHVVTDGEAALAYLRGEGEHAGKRRPELVLLDLSLPKLSGMEVLAEIQADETLRDLAVVVLSVADSDRDLVRCHNLSPDCFVEKPLSIDKYVAAIRCFPQFGFSVVLAASA